MPSAASMADVHIREACLDSFDVGFNVGSAVVQNLWA